jgi:hypothetical protein
MKRYLNSLLFSFLVVFSLSFIATEASAQCAMCKTTVESGRNGEEKLAKFGHGLNRGILYIMAMPYILISTVGFIWYRQYRKNKANG